ncbi:MAG: HD domain-containing protein [Planctomycetota bacterium]
MSEPSRRYLKSTEAGQRVDEVFVIRNVQVGTKKDGEPYLSMMVGDKSGEAAARWWGQGQAMAARLPNPGVVRIKGMMKEFNGSQQFHVDTILQVTDPDSVDYGELMPTTDKDVETMFASVEAHLRGFKSATLRTLAEAYLDDADLMAKFKRAPAAQGFHHAFLGGLLEHTSNAMNVADAACRFYPGLNRELVVFGVFVHDIAKTWELTYDCGFDYSEGGRLVGHIVKSAMWLEDKAKQAEEKSGKPIPRAVVDTLQHIVLSHHGDLELGFGSAKSPATPEAIAVHMLENFDAKMTMAMAACRWTNDEGRWTEYLRSMNGRLFRPDVIAEADAAPASDDGTSDASSPSPMMTRAMFE